MKIKRIEMPVITPNRMPDLSKPAENRYLRSMLSSLGITDANRGPFAEMPRHKVVAQAKEARALDVAIRSGKVNPATLQRVLAAHVTVQKAGRRSNPHYDAAFERCYIACTHSQGQAFDLYLIESDNAEASAGDRAYLWEAFTSALKGRRRKYKG